MREHLSEEQVNKYSEKRLNPKELLQVDNHLSVCGDCRAKLTIDSDIVVKSFQEEFTDHLPEQHLTYDQLVGYLEMKPETDREQMETHMEICSRCKTEYEDLRAFSMERKAVSKPAIYRILAVAAVLTVIALVATLRYRDDGRPKNYTTDQSAVVASINDAGTHLTLYQNGKLSGLEDVPKEYQEMVRLALLNHQVKIGVSLVDLISKGGVLRGEPVEEIPFQLIRPVGTVVTQDQPVFEWEPLAGAAKYQVTIMDIHMNLAAESGWIATTAWTPVKPLPRATLYLWQITALRNGAEIISPQPPAGEARFKIMDQDTYYQLKEDRQKYSNSLLILGLLYARHGLLDEALKIFQQLASENPSSLEIKQIEENLQKVRTGSYKTID